MRTIVSAKVKRMMSNESDWTCVNVPNHFSHIPKHSQETNSFLPWLIYQALLAIKAKVNGSAAEAKKRGQIRRRRSIPRHNSVQGIIIAKNMFSKKSANPGLNQASGKM